MATLATSVVSASLPVAIESIELRTRFSPPVTWNLSDLLAGSNAPPNPLVAFAKPTIILRGPLVGEATVAPAGVVGANEWKTNLLIAVLSGVALGAGLVWALRR